MATTKHTVTVDIENPNTEEIETITVKFEAWYYPATMETPEENDFEVMDFYPQPEWLTYEMVDKAIGKWDFTEIDDNTEDRYQDGDR